jgi:hypothetical protein
MSLAILFIALLFIAFLAYRRRREKDFFRRLGAAEPTPIGGEGWSARMGWRYVSYIEGECSLSLSIEPMVRGDDRVYVPDESGWRSEAPPWAADRQAEILERLQSVPWNRKLTWQERGCSFSRLGPNLDDAMPGSLESMPGGRALENMRMFEPGSLVTHQEAHKMWHDAQRISIKLASGPVTIEMTEVIPGSVFQSVVLPALKKNPNVRLVFK